MKRNYIVGVISALIFIAGYVICTLFFSEVPRFSYTAEWTSRHYFLFVWVIAILCAIFNLPFTSLTITAGCFIGIGLGDFIGKRIIDSNWHKINQLISEGVSVSVETLNLADYHYGVFIWLETILVAIVIGLIADMLHRRRLKKVSE